VNQGPSCVWPLRILCSRPAYVRCTECCERKRDCCVWGGETQGPGAIHERFRASHKHCVSNQQRRCANGRAVHPLACRSAGEFGWPASAARAGPHHMVRRFAVAGRKSILGLRYEPKARFSFARAAGFDPGKPRVAAGQVEAWRALGLQRLNSTAQAQRHCGGPAGAH
jgi:hypothetical protein